MGTCLSHESNVLITGVTGLIGGEIFHRLAASHCGVVWPLVRCAGGQDPDLRVRARLERSGYRSESIDCRVSPVAGDICRAGWGMSPADHERIARSVDVIIHNAADTSFAARRDTAATNVESVRRLIEFARGCRRRPLIAYMSTASNVGEVTGQCVREDEGCRPENDHFNEYTHSKAVGERLLRESGLPVLTLRPTIVLSAGLPDPAFARQILWFAPLTRVFRALPIDPGARLDLVDVRFVAEATLRLLRCPRREFDCYHLSAGREGSVTVRDLERIVNSSYERRSPLELVPAPGWTRSMHREHVNTPLRQKVFRSLRHYLPFLNMDTVYDCTRLRRAVPGTELAVLPPQTYLSSLLKLVRPKAAMREAAVP